MKTTLFSILALSMILILLGNMPGALNVAAQSRVRTQTR